MMLKQCAVHFFLRNRQTGVVLVITLILLAIVSLLSAMTLQTAINAEVIANGPRVMVMGQQAAELALKYCEEATTQLAQSSVTLPSVPTIQDYPASGTPKWQDLNNWDSARTGVYVVPAAVMNQAGPFVSYNRLPECLVERLPMANADSSTNVTSSYVITARGFGPEVAAGTARPTGAEVWLQSTIDLN
jgi:type IV pilus assembly protein PilX